MQRNDGLRRLSKIIALEADIVRVLMSKDKRRSLQEVLGFNLGSLPIISELNLMDYSHF